MRSYLICLLLLGGFGSYGYLWAQRPVHYQDIQKTTDTTVVPQRISTPKATAKPTQAMAKPVPRKPPMKRTLRITSLGWELLAPAIEANDGTTPQGKGLFAKEKLSVALSAVKRRKQLEQALAQGGAAQGADIALMSLPDFVASYERLKALQPRIFFVLGWSRGREQLFARRKSLLRWSWKRRRVKMVASPESNAAFLGYAMLALSGVPPRRVRLVLPTHPSARKAHVTALPSDTRWKHLSRRQHLLLSTAHADRLIPYVAVAPKGFLEAHPRAVEIWLRGWLRGVVALKKDVPAVARRIASIDGAPNALELLKRLGQLKMTHLRENTGLFGLSGRSPMTLSALFAHTWKIWRKAGVMRIPAPRTPPLYHRSISQLSRRHPSLLLRIAEKATKPTTRRSLLLSHYAPPGRFQMQEWTQHTAMLAAIFGRFSLRMSIANNRRKSADAIAQLRYRYNLPVARVRYRSMHFQRKRAAMLQLLGDL